MCSIRCWILSIWEALGWKFCIFGLIHALSTRGEQFELEMACCTHLEGFQVVSSYFWALAVSQEASAWPVRGTGLTCESWADAAVCFMRWIACIRPGEVALVQGELACVRGELIVVFEFWFGGLRFLFEHGFVSDVSSRCPCLRGPTLIFFKWSCSLLFFGFRSLVEVSFYSFLFLFFSLWLQIMCVVNALI
jgi:hypothetical protein